MGFRATLNFEDWKVGGLVNKSCSEKKLSDRSASSGSYVINPDGKGGWPLSLLSVTWLTRTTLAWRSSVTIAIQNSGARMLACKILQSWYPLHWGKSSSAGKPNYHIRPLWVVYQVRMLWINDLSSQVWLVGVTWWRSDDILGRK